MKKWILIVLLIIASVSFCINKNKKSKRLAYNFENTTFVDFEIDHKYLITEVEVDGVKVGDYYRFHKKKLVKINQQNKYTNFSFDLFNKQDEKIGVVYLDEDNQKSIEKIEIKSPKYKTDKAIGVGSTFKEVKESYPLSEVHGCEIEGKTIIMADDYHFLLEGISNYSYNVDESIIEASAKVKMITIRN